MKTFSLFSLVLVANFGFADPSHQQMISKIDNLYVPHGFDNNDVVEVVVSGHFTNSCQQLGDAITHIDHQAKTVTITPISYLDETRSCVQMLSPFTQVIRLGKMNDGIYSFDILGNAQIRKSLSVAKATVSDRDDFLYPPVDYATIEKDQRGEPILIIKGRYPMMKRGCMQTEQAILQFQDREMLVVQPESVVTLPGSGGCENDYEKKFRVPYSVDGKLLIHVRSINGQSYNRVVEVK